MLNLDSRADQFDRSDNDGIIGNLDIPDLRQRATQYGDSGNFARHPRAGLVAIVAGAECQKKWGAIDSPSTCFPELIANRCQG